MAVMTSSIMIDILKIPQAQLVAITDDSLTVNLSDGRIISVPLAWYPRLLHGSQDERNNWRLTGSKEGIHWPDLDEDISLKNIILGQPSGESQKSLKRWL
ncbi:MAG: DUF2442 domain-containing protein [Hormoscilla sp. GM7CHS1pb]|nr:DUF2442 domain-containing protein [Hormoscilla sp. GM7CHS1pb]